MSCRASLSLGGSSSQRVPPSARKYSSLKRADLYQGGRSLQEAHAGPQWGSLPGAISVCPETPPEGLPTWPGDPGRAWVQPPTQQE